MCNVRLKAAQTASLQSISGCPPVWASDGQLIEFQLRTFEFLSQVEAKGGPNHHMFADPMQLSHGVSPGPALRAPRPTLKAAAVRRPCVQRNSLAVAAVTGAIVWKTWTARRQRSPQQPERAMNSRWAAGSGVLCLVYPDLRNCLSTGSLTLDLILRLG